MGISMRATVPVWVLCGCSMEFVLLSHLYVGSGVLSYQGCTVSAFIYGTILPSLPHLVFGGRVSRKRSSLLLGHGALGVQLSPKAWDSKTVPSHLAFTGL